MSPKGAMESCTNNRTSNRRRPVGARRTPIRFPVASPRLIFEHPSGIDNPSGWWAVRSLRTAKRLQGREESFALFEILEQLLFQVAACRLLNCAPLGCYRFFLRLTFSRCPWLGRLRQVPDL